MAQSQNTILSGSARMLRNVLPYACIVFLMIQVWTYQAASEPINQYNYLTPNSRDSSYQQTSGLGVPTLTTGSLDFSKADKNLLNDKQIASTSGDERNSTEGTAGGLDSSTKVVGAIAAIMGTSMAGGACCGCCMDHKKKGAGCCNCCCNCFDACIHCCCPCCDEKCCKRCCKPCSKSCSCCNGCCVGCPECCGCDPHCGCCRRCRACCPCCCNPRCEEMSGPPCPPPPPPPPHHAEPHDHQQNQPQNQQAPQMGGGYGAGHGQYTANYMPY